MPISKKRFSKKRVKKSIKKNTRNHKKRTPRRKHRKSGKRSRFFGGSGFNDDIELGDIEHGDIELGDGDRSERLHLNPYPNPVLPSEHLYRVQFFTFGKDLETGEPRKVAVNLHNIPEKEIDTLANYFMRRIPGLTSDNILFYGDFNGRNPYGYIDLDLDEIYNKVVIHEGDMAVDIDPPLTSNIQSVTITKVPNFDV
jgi:hypothetical protein